MTTAQILARIANGQIISGLRNCHKYGLTSIVLRPRLNDREGMVRVFYAEKGHTMGSFIEGADFTLLPHNHRQAISLELLWGDVFNYKFINNPATKSYGLPTYKYEFSSAIADDQIGVKKLGESRLYLDTITKFPESPDKIVLPGPVIHTVEVRSETAAWIVCEWDINPEPSYCWSFKEHLKLDAHDLYVPLTEPQKTVVGKKIIEQTANGGL